MTLKPFSQKRTGGGQRGDEVNIAAENGKSRTELTLLYGTGSRKRSGGGGLTPTWYEIDGAGDQGLGGILIHAYGGIRREPLDRSRFLDVSILLR